MSDVLESFHPVVAQWFRDRFGSPTAPQEHGWPAIQAGRDVLIAAPTGSGKTLAAFLACIDRLLRKGPALEEKTEILYVSPLKALANDIRKNLEEPLGELQALAAKSWTKLPGIRTAMRSGDTTSSERQAILRNPPHILITTPESLYLLLTADKGRELLRSVKTVIVDEIHAIAKDKRGAHLALSLERLTRVTGKRPARIGLSATQRPIEEIGRFLVGTSKVGADGTPDCVIVDSGHRRAMDLAVEVPREEIGSVATKELWSDVYDRIAELVKAHKSTLVFVNTRRAVERATHQLAERLGEEVIAAHHGSLSKETRLKAEAGLKAGALKVVVATASLELGIDVGAVDLVCQVGSPRSFAVGLQRIGRSGHWKGGLPKGRLFPTTRDELLETAAFVRGVRRGNLEKTCIPAWPRDVLAQQLVAEAGSEEVDEKKFFEVVRNAWPYAKLPREEYDAIVTMLSDGVATARGRRGAWLHRDQVHGKLRGRRGARLTALSSGGAIPDTFTYAVVKEPEGMVVGNLDEDFAVESMAGDVFLLGNTSWRIRRVEAGRVRVEDAHGAAPTIPFWLGEAPGRSAELSTEVSDLRKTIEPLLERPMEAIQWLSEECGVPPEGAEQSVRYLRASREALGTLPTQDTLIAERFFDEGGGMQLILHAPFGGRLNRAFGLALRKRFCAGFNFELQAAATDDGILLSLGPQHSFPLVEVFDYLQPDTVQETLEQAVLDAPVFGVRWRWNATRALALLRQMGGKRVPPPIQRMRSDDLLAAVFPDQAACQENVVRPIHIPHHPLIDETMRDCLHEAMDLDGLKRVLSRIAGREVKLLARDTPTPSPLSHEILHSFPYTYLDDAPLEERRARAVVTRRTLSEEDLKSFGALDPEAIRSVIEEAWPDVRDPDELHDALLGFVALPEERARPEWKEHFQTLVATGRASRVGTSGSPLPPGGGQGEGDFTTPPRTFWVPTEKLPLATLAFEKQDESAIDEIVRGWMSSAGPQTAADVQATLGLAAATSLIRIESRGILLRGNFTGLGTDAAPEFCDRDLLARIHRRALSRLRREIEPVKTPVFLRYLLRWQHVAPGTQLTGARGVAEAIGQLEGLQLPGGAWEASVLPARVAGYRPEWLDELCMNGTVAWGRLYAKSAAPDGEDSPARRAQPHRNTTVSLLLREDLPWLLEASREEPAPLGAAAAALLELLEKRGAMFFNELQAVTGRIRSDLDQALWELVTAGKVTCDGFGGLRILIDPVKRREKDKLLSRYPHSRRPMPIGGGGRWSLLRPAVAEPYETGELDAHLASLYLRRYGVIFRDLLGREPKSPPWRSLLQIYRRMEARGELRAGRFVEGFAGEQFALPEAVDALRAARRNSDKTETERVVLSAADPLNLIGIVTPGPRVPATMARRISYVGGVPDEPPASGPPSETLPLH